MKRITNPWGHTLSGMQGLHCQHLFYLFSCFVIPLNFVLHWGCEQALLREETKGQMVHHMPSHAYIHCKTQHTIIPHQTLQ
jgi:hypothetical protein